MVFVMIGRICINHFFKGNNNHFVTTCKRYATAHHHVHGELVPTFRYALNWPDRIALHDEYGEYTYADIFIRSKQLAKEFTSFFDRKLQERVAFLCPNNVSYVITQWACWMSGQIAVPLSPAHPESMLEYFITDSDASVIVTVPEFASKLQNFSKDGRKLIILKDGSYKKDVTFKSQVNTILKGGLSPSAYSRMNALIIYTSGSTGLPKGVVLSYCNLHAQTMSLMTAWQWSENDVILHALPLHHTHGIINALLCPLQCGAKCIMLPKFDVATVWRYLLGRQVNMFMGVPTMYVKLIEEYEKSISTGAITAHYVRATCSQKIRLMVSGSAPLPVPVFNKWARLTDHSLLERYGMSEIGMALSNPLHGKRRPGFVGTPLPGVSVRIVDEQTVLAEGSDKGTKIYAVSSGLKEYSCSGELQVKGDNVFVEYWRKPEATAKEFTADGWFKTGDSVQYVDDNYKILGRRSVDIIKSGGYKISALFIETVLLEHPDIKDVSVVGLPDYTWGQKVVAVIVTSDEEISFPSLKKWAAEKLPAYCIPSMIKCIPEIPRNLTGKVNKVELIKQLFPVEISSTYNK